MPLVKSGRVVQDPFVRWLDAAPLPDEGAFLVPHTRLIAEGDALLDRTGPTGVIWPNNVKIADLAPYVDRLAVIALVFPVFKDGRAYSQARQLRERYAFHGELRATGQILRDQFLFMIRAGFDALEVVKNSDADAYAAVLKRYSVFYQVAGEGGSTAARRRLARLRSAAPGEIVPAASP